MPAAQATAFTVYTNPDLVRESGGDPNDRELAAAVMKALHHLQEALDRAALAGIVIEPTFNRYPNRFKDRDSDADSIVVELDVYRQTASIVSAG